MWWLWFSKMWKWQWPMRGDGISYPWPTMQDTATTQSDAAPKAPSIEELLESIEEDSRYRHSALADMLQAVRADDEFKRTHTLFVRTYIYERFGKKIKLAGFDVQPSVFVPSDVGGIWVLKVLKESVAR